MRTALLVAACLSVTGCWKEIHEAAAPRPAPPSLCDAATPPGPPHPLTNFGTIPPEAGRGDR